MDRVTAFAILEIAAEATPDEVRAAYRRRAFATHPDRAGGDAAAFHAVSDAYQALSHPDLHGARPGTASEPDASSCVPPTDAAKVLFEYLSDLASEMILNGATPEFVVAFLAREGCPESVAQALERDLRGRVRPPPREPPAPPAPVEPPAATPPARPAVPPPARWTRARLALAAAAVAGVACALGASVLEHRATARATGQAVAPPAAVDAPPTPPEPARAPAPVRPATAAPARTNAKPAPAPRARALPTSAELGAGLDAEREALEADQRRFAAQAEALRAERERIEAEEAALGPAPELERYASLAPEKAAYNARLAAARRTEKALERRVRDLNARITAYNQGLRSARQAAVGP